MEHNKTGNLKWVLHCMVIEDSVFILFSYHKANIVIMKIFYLQSS